MKKSLKIAVTFAALGLAGCVVVPSYDTPYGYGYGAPVAVAPPAVVVQPSFYAHYGYYRGYYGHRYY
jgi:hypothetical protein